MLPHAERHELLTVKETASLLRLHPMTVRRMIEQGTIPALQLAGKRTAIRIDAAELETRLRPRMSAMGGSLEVRDGSSLGRSFVGASTERDPGPPEGARQSNPARVAGDTADG